MDNNEYNTKKFFYENGYYISNNIISENEINSFKKELNILLNYQLKRLSIPSDASNTTRSIYNNLIGLYQYNQDIYISTLKVISKLKSVYDILLSFNILKICNLLSIEMPMFHSSPVFHILSNKLKIKDGYQGIGVHQDWPSLQTSLNTITVWIPLMDIDKTLFPIDVIPKSHLFGLCKGKPSTHLYEINENTYKNHEFISLEVNQGGAIFMSNFLLHKTGMTNTDQLRMAISWRYEDALEPSFAERNFPFAQTRIIKRELFIEDFPSVDLVKSIYKL